MDTFGIRYSPISFYFGIQQFQIIWYFNTKFGVQETKNYTQIVFNVFGATKKLIKMTKTVKNKKNQKTPKKPKIAKITSLLAAIVLTRATLTSYTADGYEENMCMPGCSDCSFFNSECYKCAPGWLKYRKTDKKCSRCLIRGCWDCSAGIETCKECKLGYYTWETPLKAKVSAQEPLSIANLVSAETGMSVSAPRPAMGGIVYEKLDIEAKMCLPCSSDCLRCKSGKRCDYCDVHYRLNQDTGLCEMNFVGWGLYLIKNVGYILSFLIIFAIFCCGGLQT